MGSEMCIRDRSGSGRSGSEFSAVRRFLVVLLKNWQLKTENFFGRGAILNESARVDQATTADPGWCRQNWPGRATTMRATRTTRTRSAGRRARPVKRLTKRLTKRLNKRAIKPAARPAVKPVVKVAAPPEPVLYKLCKAGWAVIVERIPNALGTRFVCPFCPKSHRVPGPVRGFKKVRHAQWGRLRRVEE